MAPPANPEPIKRQDDPGPVRTLTISKPWTTYTTSVLLGQDTPTSTPSPTSTSSEMPPYSSSAVAPASSSDTSLTQEQVGAIIGAIAGSLLSLMVVWWCLSQARSRRQALRHSHHLRRRRRSGSSSSGSSGSSSSSSGDRVRPHQWDRRRRRSSGHEFRPRPAGQQRGGGLPMRPPPAYNGFNLTPQPARFPPRVRQGYRQTPHPQFRGVRRNP